MRETEASAAARTLADLLPDAAERFGDRVALIGDDRRYTFTEAQASAVSLAATLEAAGVARGDLVVVIMHKTTDAFILFHALLGLGAVVVPLDPLMPVASTEELIASIQPNAVVGDDASLQRLGGAALALPVFTTGEAPLGISLRQAIDRPSTLAPSAPVGVQPEDPAYVIFTSGSTGVPKGITHTHRSGLAYAELAVEVHGITADDCLAGLPPLHFDMSTLELYGAPLAGAAVVPIGTAELRFPATFTERAEREGMSVWYSVPFQLRQISERGALDQRDMSTLRHVIYAGEAFSAPALSTLMQQLPGVRFSNAYGPAETNVVTVHELVEPPTSAVPIGRPWGDVAVRLVDPETDVSTPEDLLDVPVGELGELWIKATSTMAGYLQRPDLDAGRLIGSGTDRWYRSGDLVTQDQMGALHLAGRIDHQVKVRGTRLELEAVEAVLAANPQVAEAVVAPDLSGPSVEHLRAAVTLAADSADLDLRSLRRWCSARLAAVAVPIDVHVWPAFPLTSSGKIDRARVRTSLNDTDEAETGVPVGAPATNGHDHG